MKLKNILDEMAYKANSLRSVADKFAEMNYHKWKMFPHVGDIEEYAVRSDGKYYTLWDGEVPVLYVKTLPMIHIECLEVDDIWIKSEYTGKKLLSKMLWFLKSREQYSRLCLGDVHSDDTVSILKKGGLSKFKKFWMDSVSGELINFDPNDIDRYYNNSSRWKLVLENVDDYSEFPRYTNGDWIKESYDWQIE